MILYLSRVHFPVTTLGPGRRIGIWFQGCTIRCSGCISADTWNTKKDGIEVKYLIEGISPWLYEADGITISGGEPFDQPEALISLLKQLRLETSSDILVYSGYAYEKISHYVTKCDGLIDALISDPYEENTKQTLALRGSDNQRLHYLTPLGEMRFSQFDRKLQTSDKTFDLMYEEEEETTWLAGIPRRNDMVRLQHILAKKGHVAITTQDKRSMKERTL
ncbi:4Fe-4S single cluster domain-containing protein [Legionella quateirensis]|uniref:Pyruvate formate-lyase 1-activating enzyme n=1 Tax=Legionella quateirensis TaxID=45072 RepID=A0A378KTI4_9GAMM|nr:4Fe-4S single cluster domain-containing protein [Legionella quateirensis]KTD47815.1 Pyruvate formate-lyase 1-activating enzyme [Legionella quateirensis]STY16708.1 Pyruvate formate-lyase 1-activating enzyme [Legionella quateirensis]